MPSTALKDNAFLTNSTTINLDAYVSLIASKKGWDGKIKGRTFGINVGGTYNIGSSSNPSATLPTAFAVTGQTTSNVAYKGVDPRSLGFRVGAGPQMNFYVGNHFIVSPIILAEYFSMTQKTLSAVQTTWYNGKDYDFNLTTLPETKTSGFAITPRLRLQYQLAKNIGLFVEGAYTTGPKTQTTIAKLIPNDNPQTPSNTYNLQQLQRATYVNAETKKTSYNAMSFEGGITFKFGDRVSSGKQRISKQLDKDNTAVKASSSCSCVAPPPNYIKEYPSSGSTLSITHGWPSSIPTPDLSSGNKIHLGFATGPCYNTISDPCYGFWKATVNGHIINSTSVGYTSQTHIEIPISYFIVGANTITVQGISGSTVCNINSTIVYIGVTPPTGGGTSGTGGILGGAVSSSSVSTVNTPVLIPEGPHRTVGTETAILWDGTIYGLFKTSNPDIIVPKNGGVEKLVAQINKAGKAKASIYKRQDKSFIKILDKDVNSYYEITNSTDNPMGIIIGSGGVTCKVATCPNGSDCKLFPWNGSEKCMCDDGTPSVNYGCGIGGLAVPIGTHLPHTNIGNVAVTFEPGGTTISSGSIRDIKNLMLQEFPNATVTNTEIVKEKKEKFIKISLKDGENLFTVFNWANNNLKQRPNGSSWILIGCTGTCGGNILMCNSKNVNLLGGCYCGAGDNKCFGFSVSLPHSMPNVTIEK